MSGRQTVRRSRAVPDRHELGRADQPLDELVEDASHDDDARRGRALLPGVPERALRDRGHRDVEVGVGVDDDRVLAAHLGDDALHVSLPRGERSPRAR